MQNGLSRHEAETEASIAMSVRPKPWLCSDADCSCSVTGAFPSASAINVLALHITTNPLILKTLREEIDQALENGELIDPPSFADLTRLPYFQACIDEALRLVPPVVQLRERLVPPEGDEINGVHLPGGTAIGFNMQAMLQSEHFGSRPEEFRPERWSDALKDPERLKMMRKIHGLIFGYGSTKCLGIMQASMIVYKFIFEVSLTSSAVVRY
jgi:cytochrome P450